MRGASPCPAASRSPAKVPDRDGTREPMTDPQSSSSQPSRFSSLRLPPVRAPLSRPSARAPARRALFSVRARHPERPWRPLSQAFGPRPPRSTLRPAADPRARPSGRSKALAEELANGRRGRQHNVEWLQNVNTTQPRAGPSAALLFPVPVRDHPEPAPPALRCAPREGISSPPTQGSLRCLYECPHNWRTAKLHIVKSDVRRVFRKQVLRREQRGGEQLREQRSPGWRSSAKASRNPRQLGRAASAPALSERECERAAPGRRSRAGGSPSRDAPGGGARPFVLHRSSALEAREIAAAGRPLWGERSPFSHFFDSSSRDAGKIIVSHPNLLVGALPKVTASGETHALSVPRNFLPFLTLRMALGGAEVASLLQSLKTQLAV
ncbi:uncharacterized protein LOC134739972 [Pongo pygmaeus]|uniref:uncharacterized protein LOC134739972 n=1 Tax=Pongo pygmaeus TaxID=9600 RepID=UPI00300CBE1A